MRSLLGLALAAATLHGAGAQYCSPGSATICDSVLIVHSTSSSSYEGDVQAALQRTGAFAAVDTFNAGSSTPAASLLAAYHAVFVFCNNDFGDGALLGDRLAAYHDQGGGVIVVEAANVNGRLRGTYGTPANSYALLDYAAGAWAYGWNSLGDVLEPESPLLTGLASFSTLTYWSTAPVVSSVGVVVVRWQNGLPLVLRGARGERTLVELNFWPSPTNQDWAAGLMLNAIKYSRCKLCAPGTFAAAGAN